MYIQWEIILLWKAALWFAAAFQCTSYTPSTTSVIESFAAIISLERLFSFDTLISVSRLFFTISYFGQVSCLAARCSGTVNMFFIGGVQVQSSLVIFIYLLLSSEKRKVSCSPHGFLETPLSCSIYWGAYIHNESV